MPRFSILYKVLIAYIIILLPTLILIAEIFESNRKEIEGLLITELRQSADDREALVLLYLQMNKDRIHDFSTDGFIVNALESRDGQAGRVLTDYMKQYKLPLVTEMYRLSIVTAPDGKVLASTLPGWEGEDLSREKFFKEGLRGVSVTEVATKLGPEITVSAPVYSRLDPGKVIGVITGFTELSRFGEFFTGEYIRRLGALTFHEWGRWATFDIYLVNKDKLMLTQSRFVPGSALKQKVDTYPVRECLEHQGEETGIYPDYKGKMVVGASMCFPGLGWTLVTEVAEKEVFAPITRNQRLTFLAVMLVTMLIGALALYFILAIVRRLKALARGAGEIAAGNYGVRVPVKARDEIGFLSSSFNEMAESIGKRTEELLASQRSLVESEMKYRTLIENLQEGIWVIDENAVTVYVNPRMAEMLGYTVAEMIGRSAFDFMDDQGRAIGRARIERRRSGVKESGDLEFIKKDGERIYVTAASAPLIEAGQYKGSISGIIDITERRRAEEALRESEERFRAILDNMGNVVYLKDLEGRHIFANRLLEIVSRKNKEEMLGKTSFELFPEESARQFDENDRKVMEYGRPMEFEESLPQQDGVHTYISIKFPMKDTKGATYAVCGVSTDITSIKNTEEALRKSELSLRAAQRTAHIGNWEWDMATGAVYKSDEVFRIFGRREESFNTEADYVGALHPDDREEVVEGFRKAIESGTRYSVDARIIRGDGAERIVYVQGEVERDESGVAARMTGIVQDITERKRAEEELAMLARELEMRVEERTRDLQRAIDELAAAKAEIETFTYSVAHDLRAPLRLIDGFTMLLVKKQRDVLDRDGQDHLDRIRAAARRMGQLIDDLMNLSYVMRAELVTGPVDLSAMAMSIMSDLKSSQPEREVRFYIEEGLSARGDEKLLRMVLENLLGNAWKFTSKTPEPWIELRKTGIDDNRDVFCVRDNGTGFDMEHAGRLFHPFQRLHSHDEFPGTGIGLATVSRIVQRHGGRVWAEGERGAGAAFYFTLENWRN